MNPTKMKRIENINVLNRQGLLKDLRTETGYPISALILIVNRLDFNTVIEFPDNENPDTEITFDIFRVLERSRNIEYNAVDEEPEPESIRTELIDNKLVNPLGLTQYEMWFNTLSDEQKQYVQDLAHNTFYVVCSC